VKRAERKENFGIVLIPEGLIEFIPEIKILFQELNDLLAHNAAEFGALGSIKDQKKWVIEKLTPPNAALFSSLPKEITAQFLLDRAPIPLALQSRMGIYCFGNLICAYFCLHVLITNLPSYTFFPGAFGASCLLSLFVFLVFGAIKHIAFDFRFVRVYDIENGALALFAMLSIIVRYVVVTPIWLSVFGNAAFTKLPDEVTALCWIYLAVKVGGFFLLCWDFGEMCDGFFKSVLLRASPGTRCQRCNDGTVARVTTQCGHSFCLECIDNRRQVEGACPVCKRRIPRKWVMPLKDGTISRYLLLCML
jgi:hypothetical protein